MPHDGDQHRHGQSNTVIEQYQGLGWDVKMLPRESAIETGIARGRNMIHKAVFDRDGTTTGRAMLGAYKYEFNEKTQTWTQTPVHDFSSHGADAWRYLAQANALGYTTDRQWGNKLDYSQMDKAQGGYA